MNTRRIFGALIVTILLALYGLAVISAIQLAYEERPGTLPAGFSLTMSTVGGLVSALVISELAVTKTTEPPAARRVLGVRAADQIPDTPAAKGIGILAPPSMSSPG